MRKSHETNVAKTVTLQENDRWQGHRGKRRGPGTVLGSTGHGREYSGKPRGF